MSVFKTFRSFERLTSKVNFSCADIEATAKIGDGTTVWAPCNIYGCTIGAGCKIGPFVEIQRGAVIGDRCHIASHSFICDGVTLEEGVFVGHGVMFCNTVWPRAVNERGELRTRKDWALLPVLVKRGASIGSGAVILPGVTVGERAMVAAGAVVASDVPPRAVVVGNPATVRYQPLPESPESAPEGPSRD